MAKISSQEKVIHDQFVQYGRNAKEWMRKCVLLLPYIEKYKIWEKKGFDDIYDYARKLAGMSPYKVKESLRILRKIEDKPALMKVVEQKGVLAVKPVVTMATAETAVFWAEKAMGMTKNILETYVKEVRGQNGLLEGKADDFGRPRTPEQGKIPQVKVSVQEKICVAMELEPQVAEELKKLKGKGEWNDLMKEFLAMRREKLKSEKPEEVRTGSRHIPAKIQRYVTARTNGQCAFPHCIKPAEIFQHTQRWALERVHDPDRLYGLCKEHERIAHLGLIENEEQSPQKWKVRAQPDVDDPKYEIDLVVQKFRNRCGAG